MKTTLAARTRPTGDAHPHCIRQHQLKLFNAELKRNSHSLPLISALHTERKLETNTIITMEKNLDSISSRVDSSSSSSGRTKGAWIMIILSRTFTFSHACLACKFGNLTVMFVLLPFWEVFYYICWYNELGNLGYLLLYFGHRFEMGYLGYLLSWHEMKIVILKFMLKAV